MANYISTGMGASCFGTASISVKKKSDSSKKRVSQNRNKIRKKPLNYNPREISNQILRAVKTESARFVLTRAKTKLGVLKRCIGTGQYEERELLAAVAHAQRMVNCARLKVKNLKEEEQKGHENEEEKANNQQRKKNEVKRRVSQKEQELKSKMAQEKMQLLRKEKMNQQELIRRKKMHRSQELTKIQEADMKYLKDKTNNNPTQTNYSGVSLELSGTAMGLQELQLSDHAIELMEKQLEQEIEMQVEMQMAGMTFTEGAAVDTGGVSEVTTEAAVPTSSIDVSV